MPLKWTGFENIVGKGENAGKLNLSSANAFNLVKANILLLGRELKS